MFRRYKLFLSEALSLTSLIRLKKDSLHIIKSDLTFRILSLPRFLYLNPSVLSNLNKCVLPYGKLISSINFSKVLPMLDFRSYYKMNE